MQRSTSRKPVTLRASKASSVTRPKAPTANKNKTPKKTAGPVTPAAIETYPLVLSPTDLTSTPDVKTVLQAPTVLSQSGVWAIMQHYYQNAGPEAFLEVPYYGSSNTNLAEGYADSVLAYWSALPANAPLQVVELAAGSGRLTFLLLHHLAAKWPLYPHLANRSMRFIVTDFVEASIQAILSHPKLQSWVQNGTLTGAVVNPLTDAEIRCLDSGKPLTSGPMVVVANYIFDTLQQDAYQVQNGVLHHALLGLAVPTAQTLPAHTMPTMAQVDLTYEYTPVDPDTPVYANPLWNTILTDMAQPLHQSSFLMPVGALRTLDWLHALSGGQLLLLSSDKGYQNHEQHLGLNPIDLALHGGAFSLEMNYQAVAQWVAAHQGHTCTQMQGYKNPITTYAGVVGLPADANMTGLHTSVTQHFGTRNPSSFSVVNMVSLMLIQPQSEECPLNNQLLIESLLQGIALAGYDPYFISKVAGNIYAMLPYFTVLQKQTLLAHLDLGWQQYYHFAAEPRYAMVVGVLLVSLGMHYKALPLLHWSHQNETNGDVCYWLGRCYEALCDPKPAHHWYTQAHQMGNCSMTDLPMYLSRLTVILNERTTLSDRFIIPTP
jgi:hypothetical protein